MSRRGFIIGGVAAGVLGACGADQSAPPPQLVALFSPDHVIAAGLAQRIPFAVVDLGDLIVEDDVELPVRVLLDGDLIDTTSVVGRIVEHGHVDAEDEPDHQHADLLRYFALRTSLPEVGVYDIEVDFGAAGTATLPVQAFDRSEVNVVVPGARLPVISTPTLSSPEGISPLCTRAPEICPFHGDDVAEVLRQARPLALLVATPALCSTRYCGPVVETMIDVAPEFADDISFVHLEVYANASEVDGNYEDPAIEVARPVSELGLAFEPSLILVDASGMIVDRIDNIYDGGELRAALSALGTS